MDMCPLHNNYVGENTSCPACVLLSTPTAGNPNLLATIERKNHVIADLVDEMRIRGYHYKIMKWAAVAGWACTVILLAFGDKL